MQQRRATIFSGRNQRRRRSYRATTCAFSRSQKFTAENDQILISHYILNRKIEKAGDFGCDFFKVVNKESEQEKILKTQPLKSNPASQTLLTQYRLLRQIGQLKGIPKIINFGKTNHLYFLEMDNFKEDLSHPSYEIKTSIGTLCDFVIVLIQILRQIHHKKIVHRDIQPENIIIHEGQTLLVGFGKACFKTTQKTRNIKTFAYGSHYFVGSPKYASISAHRGQSARFSDDIESLLYIFIELRMGILPWSIDETDHEAIMKIGKIKKKTSRKELCRGMPICFLKAFDHIDRALDDKISYDQILDSFKFDRQLEQSISMKELEMNKKRSIDTKERSHTYILPNRQKDANIQKDAPTILINNIKIDLGIVKIPEEHGCSEVGEEYQEAFIPLSVRLSKLTNQIPKFKATRLSN